MSDKTKRTPELDNVKTATAILFAALVKTLDEMHPGLKQTFVAKLDEGYAKIRNDSDDLNALETLSWTRTMITGFNLSEESKPFFD
ncbi:hypothetical protein ACKWRH_26560 [Bradyrhizobium sp. Pa8]|uniref:hypothetical protein n=1 Tax=Bradyrhizobium sp. Pa8 TaxID=3386552 RepID=UPI00403FBE45